MAPFCSSLPKGEEVGVGPPASSTSSLSCGAELSLRREGSGLGRGCLPASSPWNNTYCQAEGEWMGLTVRLSAQCPGVLASCS